MNRLIRYTYPRNATLNSWSGLDSDVSRLLEVALSDFAAPAYAPRFPVDLYEDKANTYVRAELPGVNRDAINLEIVDGVLNISASRQEKGETVSISRSVALPEGVQADKVTATYENGILTVTLPRQEQAKPRKIDISVN